MTIYSPNTLLTGPGHLEAGQAAGSISPVPDLVDLVESATGLFPQAAQTASYTAALADRGTVTPMNVATSNTFTVPPNSSVAFGVGTLLGVLQIGAGQTTITAGSGVTILPSTLSLLTRGVGSMVWIWQYSTNTWYTWGDYA